MAPTDLFDGVVFDQNNQYKDDDKLMVQFFVQAVQNNFKTGQEGRPIFDEVDMVRIITPGDKSILVQKATLQYQLRFPKQWAAYRANREQTVEGTPLEEVPFLSVGQIAELKAVNVRTLEQLANIPDSQAQNFMGYHGLRQRARNLLEAAKENAPMERLQAELEKRDNDIDVLKRQNAELAAKLDKLLAATAKA